MHSLSCPEAAKIWTKIGVKWFSAVALASLVFWQSGCGGGTTTRPDTANISISPTSAMVGSPDLTLKVSASKNFTFGPQGAHYITVLWSQGGRDTGLMATFISSSQLTATVPAALLASPVTATIHVEIWNNPRDDGPIATSSSVFFQVTPSPLPANISISPSSASVGSPDLTLTILASNNFTFHNGIWHSLVLWTQDGVDTGLQANFVNSSELTAIVPAALLASPVNATIRVEIYDNVEGTVVSTSSSVPFQVTSTSTPSPSISSISPSTVSAGSPDVTWLSEVKLGHVYGDAIISVRRNHLQDSLVHEFAAVFKAF